MASCVAIGRIVIAAAVAAAVAVALSNSVDAGSFKLDGGWKVKTVKAKDSPAKASKGASYQPVTFADLPGWAQDDHLAAFTTFLKSCERVVANAREKAVADKGPAQPALVAACSEARRLAGEIKGKDKARAFFERHFTPSAVENKTKTGLLTGYYEPVLKASRTPQGPYQTPIYRRPADLVTIIPETHRGAVKPGTLTHVRKTEKGSNEPYFTRAQIDQGALKGKGLELLYFADSVDVFFMQIQGSGRIQLTDGTSVRVHYDGKNGHPYSSIGRYLIDKALLAADKVSLGALATWLKADAARANKVMWHNASYVFFRELKGDEAGAPLGALNVPLTAGRSLALDPSFHALGTPVYVSAPTMTHVTKPAPFNRLMIGQDVGSAIKGPERGDIYFGSGDAAGQLAGVTKHPGRFFVLVPKDPTAGTPEKAAAQKTAQ